jgi:hypothetical protein
MQLSIRDWRRPALLFGALLLVQAALARRLAAASGWALSLAALVLGAAGPAPER